MQRTFVPKVDDVQRRWLVVDADGIALGRLATRVATILRGKHKPMFTPHLDLGDHVIVINAGKVKLTGNKLDNKMYYRHSGFPGGLKTRSYREMMARKPEFLIEKAVRGMLPKNRLGRAMAKKLRVYAGSEHPHQAQKPVPADV